MDFKNQGEAKVFKCKDPRVQSLSYLEKGVYLYCVNKVIMGLYVRRLFITITSIINEVYSIFQRDEQ